MRPPMSAGPSANVGHEPRDSYLAAALAFAAMLTWGVLLALLGS